MAETLFIHVTNAAQKEQITVKCFYCTEKIVGHRNVAFTRVAGERVPFHASLVRDCLNDYLQAERASEHQADDTYGIRPCPSNE